MEELKVLWDRIEKRAIYAVLLIFFFLELAAYLVPSIASFMDTRGALVLISLVLIFIFRQIDERLTTQNILIPAKGFLQGTIELLERKNEYATVDIFAHTGSIHCRAFLESRVKVRNLRILLRNMESIDKVQFPSENKDKTAIRLQLERVIKDWQQLQQEGRIETLQILYYPFEPMAHFMILDGRLLFFGLYTLEHRFPGIGARKHDTYYVSADTPIGRVLINDFKTEFEGLWSEFGSSDC